MSLYSPATTTAEIAKLSCLSVTDLQAEWARVFGTAAPKSARREYLLRAITYQRQCASHGGLPAALLRSLRKLCAENSTSAEPNGTPTRTLKPGARILREWKGAVHEVEVVEAGYRYGAQTYKSLSVIARQITGTRWSGPVFFGLKKTLTEIGHGL
jgi:hypothetical protein